MKKFHVIIKGKKDVRVAQQFADSIEVVANSEVEAQEKAVLWASVDGAYDLAVSKVIAEPSETTGAMALGDYDADGYVAFSVSQAEASTIPSQYVSYSSNSGDGESNFFATPVYIDPFETGMSDTNGYAPYDGSVSNISDDDDDFFTYSNSMSQYVPYQPWNSTQNNDS